MSSRLELQDFLSKMLGSKNVYYQPPYNVKMNYPCIVYDHSQINTIHADDNPYNQRKAYSITIIDKNPDSNIPNKFYPLPLCRFDRTFVADNLNHTVFTLFY